MRHNLSLNSQFIKLPKDPSDPHAGGKGGFWTLDPVVEDLLIDKAFKMRGRSGGPNYRYMTPYGETRMLTYGESGASGNSTSFGTGSGDGASSSNFAGLSMTLDGGSGGGSGSSNAALNLASLGPVNLGTGSGWGGLGSAPSSSGLKLEVSASSSPSYRLLSSSSTPSSNSKGVAKNDLSSLPSGTVFRLSHGGVIFPGASASSTSQDSNGSADSDHCASPPRHHKRNGGQPSSASSGLEVGIREEEVIGMEEVVEEDVADGVDDLDADDRQYECKVEEAIAEEIVGM